MKTVADLAIFIRQGLKRSLLSQQQLGEQAGIARRTLTGVLSGHADYKVTTLMAILDRLGYELTIVPKDAMAGLDTFTSFEPTAPVVLTRVEQALKNRQKG